MNLQSTQGFNGAIQMDESVTYSMESFMKPQVIDNSINILSAQKIREVNYKFRKRKVDMDDVNASQLGYPNQVQLDPATYVQFWIILGI